MTDQHRRGLAGLLQRNEGQTGNAFRDQWLAERDENQVRRLEAAAAQAGLKLQPATILRPLVFPKSAENVVGGQEFILSFYFPYACYVRRITSSLTNLRFNPNEAPDTSTLPVDTRQYIKGRIERASGELLFENFVTCDQWSGDGENTYIFDLIPFVPRADTLNITLRVNERVETIDEVQFTFHCMRFPVEGI